jgi:hypothetical protein
LNFVRYNTGNDSNLPLDQDITNICIDGDAYTLDLNGYEIANCSFTGALLSGIGTSMSTPVPLVLDRCRFGSNNSTLPPFSAHQSSLGGVITLAPTIIDLPDPAPDIVSNTFIFDNCSSGGIGIIKPIVDLDDNHVNLHLRHYSGSIELCNITHEDTTVFIEGEGELDITNNCDAGIITVSGNFYITGGDDFVLAGGTLNTLQNYQHSQTIDDIRASQPDGIEKSQPLEAFEFVMVDKEDHVTPLPGITAITAQRSIDGSAWEAVSASAGSSITELGGVGQGGGMYYINLASEDLAGDVISFRFNYIEADTRFVTIKTDN